MPDTSDGLEDAFASLSVGERGESSSKTPAGASPASPKSSSADSGVHLDSAFSRLSVATDDDDTRLVKELYRFIEDAHAQQTKKRARFLVRTVDHKVEDPETRKEHTITSWNMSEYEYKKDPCPFPTRARGLFTEQVGQERYRIVARGYDKFFNVGEVSWTKWDILPEKTKAPYYLTIKSNGCIILIAALSSSSLLVTSKHSMGSIQGREQSHAQRGDYWVDKHLARVGRTRRQLAQHLWTNKLTAVAELCDDEFEEHVIPYPPATTGLHLHGLNVNTAHLLTYPPDEVAAFARQWGFIETAFETLQSVEEVKRFTDECAKTGRWRDNWAEGFVVRASSVDTFGGEEKRLRAFMWKVKFDEPYLMWREWREKTKTMLANKRKGVKATAPVASAKGKAHRSKGGGAGEELYGINVARLARAETREYVRWCVKAIDEHPDWFEDYNEGRGIVAVRDRFLEWLETDEGKDALTFRKQDWHSLPASNGHVVGDLSAEAGDKQRFDKTLIVPIAIPGCGKTSMALALAELFEWGHTQSDDITSKKPAPHFLAHVKELLQDEEHKVVIADKNNHCKQHREDLVRIVHELKPKLKIRLIALVWDVHERPQDEVLRICSERITDRGERHQALRPSDTKVDDVLAMFFAQRDDFDPATNGNSDGWFHGDLLVSIDRTPQVMLDDIIEGLTDAGVVSQSVSREAKDEALRHALEYEPAVRKHAKTPSKPKSQGGGHSSAPNGRSRSQSGASKKHPSLPDKPTDDDHGDLPERPPRSRSKEKKAKAGRPRYYGVSVDCDLTRLLNPLGIQLPGPVTKSPHLTIVHQQELPDRQTTWDSAVDAAGEEVDVFLGPRLALLRGRVASLEAQYEPGYLIEGASGYDMHLTIATGQGVKAIEGKHIAHAMRDGRDSLEDQRFEVIEVPQLQVKGVVRGLFA